MDGFKVLRALRQVFNSSDKSFLKINRCELSYIEDAVAKLILSNTRFTKMVLGVIINRLKITDFHSFNIKMCKFKGYTTRDIIEVVYPLILTVFDKNKKQVLIVTGGLTGNYETDLLILWDTLLEMVIFYEQDHGTSAIEEQGEV